MGLTLTKSINITLPKDDVRKYIDEMLDTMLFNITDGQFEIEDIDDIQKAILYKQIINALRTN